MIRIFFLFRLGFLERGRFEFFFGSFCDFWIFVVVVLFS